MLEFLVGYLLGSAASVPSRPLTDAEVVFFAALALLLVLVGVPALVGAVRRGL